MGDLVDTRTRTNITEARLAETNKIDFAKLPFENAVKVVKGTAARKIAVFSDPNCPYCKQLETTLKSVDNVTRLHLPVPGFLAGFDGQVEVDLVLEGSLERVGRLDARPHDADRRRVVATRPPSTRT